MARTIVIRLDEADLDQLLDGLQARADCWRDTQRYLETGRLPRPDFSVEECSDAGEARHIAEHYGRIVREIAAQRSEQV